MSRFVSGPIVLLTDFGNKDAFAGILKGVIRSINTDVDIIDLTHEIRPMDIDQASFALYSAYLYFPQKSIFCVVVDPGVGSHRKAICIETENYLFIGPDNGVLWPAAKNDGIRKIIHITNSDYFLRPVSSTFHGRDIFAPVCAHLASGIKNLSCLGPLTENCVKKEFADARIRADNADVSVINIDRFGNLTLNITHDRFFEFIQNTPFRLVYREIVINQVLTSYAEAMDDTPFLIAASSGFMEISVKNGSAKKQLGAGVSDICTLII